MIRLKNMLIHNPVGNILKPKTTLSDFRIFKIIIDFTL